MQSAYFFLLIECQLTQQSEVKESTINIRIPVWAYGDDTGVSVNGQGYSRLVPGTFLTIRQKWTPGDKISINLPVNLGTEAIKGTFSGFFFNLDSFISFPVSLF